MAHKLRFARALKLARKFRGMAQDEFSSLISRTYISSLERGLKSPTLGKIEEIAGVLSIHPMTLLAMTFLQGQSDEQLKSLLILMEAEIASIKGNPDKPES